MLQSLFLALSAYQVFQSSIIKPRIELFRSLLFLFSFWKHRVARVHVWQFSQITSPSICLFFLLDFSASTSFDSYSDLGGEREEEWKVCACKSQRKRVFGFVK